MAVLYPGTCRFVYTLNLLHRFSINESDDVKPFLSLKDVTQHVKENPAEPQKSKAQITAMIHIENNTMSSNNTSQKPKRFSGL
jgi:hypothetical protein